MKIPDKVKLSNKPPIPAHIIDKRLASTGLLAQVLVAKYADHVLLHRQ